MDFQSLSPKSARIEKEKRKNAFASGPLQETLINSSEQVLSALFT
jgi:hypothetical protein